MRLKHSNKKHRVVTLAAEKINQQISSNFHLQSQNDLAQQIMRPKQNMQNSQEIHSHMESSIKSNFKECKIREFVKGKHHSPTYSDFDYIDTIEHYKSYLKKVKNTKSKNKKKQKTQNQGLGKSQIVPERQCIHSKINDVNSIATYQKLSIIKEKIQKIKNLGLKYNSQKELQNVYDQIYKVKTQQSNVKLNEHFNLISIEDYLKHCENEQSCRLKSSERKQRKDTNPRLLKRPTSHEAKRWYQPKRSCTERQVDPLSLIQMINLDNWKHKNNKNNDLKEEKVKKFQPFQDKRQNKTSYFQNKVNMNNEGLRPRTANYSNEQRCKAQKNSSLDNKQKIKTRQKIFNSKFPDSELYLKQKVKGIRHVERQKYGWKEFKKEMQTVKINQINKKRSQNIFQYPWNKRNLSFSVNNQYLKR